jgi:tRNA nucleotidyltransferase/poly(A) polymerase
MNALLQDLESGEIIDYVGGLNDIKYQTINTVGLAEDRFHEDYLRLLRAVRFSITKGFQISVDIHNCLQDQEMIDGLFNVSVERIYEEIYKCFKFDTVKTLDFLESYNKLRNQVFDGLLWLKPTLELK